MAAAERLGVGSVAMALPAPPPFRQKLTSLQPHSNQVTPAQVVLRWAIQRGWLVVPKTSSEDRLVANRDVFAFELSGAEVAAISALSRRHAEL